MAAALPLADDSLNFESPYPGLRSFRPEDSDYFFGRKEQIAEVVERLQRNRFVAVLGGSGSGKSSLVLAGAIPRLRTMAIQEAGDLWIPIICTPGTNLGDGNTPLTRLAMAFCAVRDPALPDRLEECVELLREPNGFGLMVEKFGRELRNPNGLELTRADLQVNFLILIDQFEELFHPSNMQAVIAEDCAHLANRIVEQFKSKHAQVCVALTMRSEHLNDCPRYQDLPDAINHSGYLVKRLVGEDLKRAIREPAQSHLIKRRAVLMSARRRSRSVEDIYSDIQIPEEIPFSSAVLSRLLRDSEAVFHQKDHADQLPLLQHTLFWIWRAACARNAGSAIPDEITLQDLCVAVLPDGTCQEPLDDSVNALEACLENRCESVFAQHPHERWRWERAFRGLAFKEPNSGNYTQQRMSMAEIAASMALPGDDLAALEKSLSPWLAPHAYLHWDAPCRTVKVAHETLIRRWCRLRNWIDDEDALFQVYIRLLEDCARWLAKGGDELATGVALRRYEDASMMNALRDKSRVDRLERLLAMDRDGNKFAHTKSRALDFLSQSKERDAQQRAAQELADQQRRDAEVAKAKAIAAAANAESLTAKALAQSAQADANSLAQQEKARRQFLVAMALLSLAILLVLSAGYQTLRTVVLNSDHVMNVSYRLSAETTLRLSNQSNGFGEASSPLRNALTSAKLVIDARDRATNIPANWLSRIMHHDVAMMRLSSQLAEQRTVTGMRSVLSSAVWAVAPGGSGFRHSSAVPCDQIEMDGRNQPSARNQLPRDYRFFPHPTRLEDGLIVLDAQETVFAGRATKDRLGKILCAIDAELITAPSTEATRIGIAGDLSHIVLSLKDSIQVHSVLWNPQPIGARAGLTVSNLPGLSIAGVAGPAVSLPAANRRFARDLLLNEHQTIRVFDVEASAFSLAEATSGQRFEELSPDGLCSQLVQKQPDTKNNTEWDGEIRVAAKVPSTYCLRISHVPTQAFRSQQFVVTLYKFEGSHSLKDELTLPILDQYSLGPVMPTEFRLDGDAGWLAFRLGSEQWLAIPWGLNTLVSLGVDVFQPNELTKVGNVRFKRVYDEVLDPEHTRMTPDALKRALTASTNNPRSLAEP